MPKEIIRKRKYRSHIFWQLRVIHAIQQKQQNRISIFSLPSESLLYYPETKQNSTDLSCLNKLEFVCQSTNFQYLFVIDNETVIAVHTVRLTAKACLCPLRSF